MARELRSLPSVDKILTDARFSRTTKNYPHDLVVSVIREELERQRQSIQSGKSGDSLDEIIDNIIGNLASIFMPSLRRVINASGVILHTNLGRAPLSQEALAAMEEASRGYSNLELDLESGNRGSRHVHVENPRV